MSIKISGKNNTISKENNNNNVYIYDALYVGGQPVDPKGEESTNYVTIDSNGVKDIRTYAPNTVFRIRVTNYRDMSNTKKEDGYDYYDVTTNNYDIDITNLEGYTHFFVNISDPGSGGDDPEGPTDPEEPADPKLPDPFTVILGPLAQDTKPSKEVSNTSTQSIDSDNFNVIIWGDARINCKLIINPEQSVNLGKFNISLFMRTTGQQTGTLIIPSEYKISINYTFEVANTATGSSYKLSCHANTEGGVNLSYDIEQFELSITHTEKEESTNMSLRNSYNDMSSYSINNLIVNNDSLIQGNLTVNGYVNDLKWYWDYINFDATVINLGAGFLAKLIDTNIVIDENTISIPTLQLSPGSVYTTDSYNVSWKSDGSMIIESSKTISNIAGLIQVLRYE